MRKDSIILVVVCILLTFSIPAGRSTASSETLEQLSLAVGGMGGAWCIGPVQAALEGVPGVKKVIVDLGTAIVMYEKGKVNPEELIKALEEKGFSGLMLEVFNLRVVGIGCAGCPEKIEEALLNLPGVRSVSFYLDREDNIEVACEKGKVSAQRLFGTLKEKGFSAEILQEEKWWTY